MDRNNKWHDIAVKSDIIISRLTEERDILERLHRNSTEALEERDKRITVLTQKWRKKQKISNDKDKEISLLTEKISELESLLRSEQKMEPYNTITLNPLKRKHRKGKEDKDDHRNKKETL